MPKGPSVPLSLGIWFHENDDRTARCHFPAGQGFRCRPRHHLVDPYPRTTPRSPPSRQHALDVLSNDAHFDLIDGLRCIAF